MAKPVFWGRVQCLLPEIPEFFRQYNSRNNQMLLMTFLQIKSEIDNTIKQYGVGRVAVIIGTSTSGISDGEDALFIRKIIMIFLMTINSHNKKFATVRNS